MTEEARQSESDDDLGYTIVAAIGLGAVAASLFTSTDAEPNPFDDTFSGGGGDFGGGGASDDF